MMFSDKWSLAPSLIAPALALLSLATAAGAASPVPVLRADTGSSLVIPAGMDQWRGNGSGDQIYLYFDHGRWNVTRNHNPGGNRDNGWGVRRHDPDDGDWHWRRHHVRRDDGIYPGEPIFGQHRYWPLPYQNHDSVGYFGKHYGDGL